MKHTFSNYDKMKDSMTEIFLQYDQEKMIQKFSLRSDRTYLYVHFVGHTYRVHRISGTVQWSDDDFKTTQEASLICFPFSL